MKSLEEYSEKLKKNAAKSYEAYLSERPKHEDVSYYDSIKKAKTTRAMTDAEYGTDASRLLLLGLGTSGYRDYIEARSEASLSDSISQASEERALTEYRGRAGYEKYLSDYNNLQNKISEGLIAQISEGYDFDLDKAIERAVAAGLSETLAYSTAFKAVTLAKQNAYNEAITFAKINKLTAKRAKEYAKSLGLDDIYAERVYDEISIFNDEDKEFLSSMSANQYYDYIKQRAEKEKKG